MSKTKTLTNNSPDPDSEQMLNFKRWLHGNAPTWFLTLPERKGVTKEKPRNAFGILRKHRAALLAANRKGAGIFMTVNTLTGNARNNESATAVNAVFIDIDGTMTYGDIQALNPQPHAIVQSSRKRYHAYWKVKDMRVEEFTAVQKALAQRFNTDASVVDVARVMRVPGTLHFKTKPVLVKLRHIDKAAKPLTVAELVESFELKLDSVPQEVATKDKSSVQPNMDVVEEVRHALSAIPVADDRPTWLNLGMAIHDALPNQEGLKLWTDWSRKSSKFDEADQIKNWKSFRRGGGVSKSTLFAMARDHGWQHTEPESLPTDEFGLVEEFSRRISDKLCYDPTCKKWMVFEQPTWLIDDARVNAAAQTVVETLSREAKGSGNPVVQQLVKRFANPSGVRRLLSDAADKPALNIHRTEFDTSQYLLAVANGVIDLRTGTFRPGLPQDRLIRRAPTAYDPAAPCPRFEAFIRFVTRERKLYARFLQRALGYTLFGHANEHVFFVVFGRTRNGKGTLFRILMAVLGDFITAVSPNLLSKAYSGNPNGPTPAIMALHGGRMFQCSEGEERHRFDTAFMKQVAGNDLLTARPNFGEQVQFTAIGKFWISANHLPDVPAQDDAMWERYRLLPFEGTVESRVEGFENALQEEASGILNWLVEGAKTYASEGLGNCNVVERATRRARGAGDSVKAWIDESCIVDADARLQSSLGYESYRKLCKLNGVQPMAVQKFRSAMADKGYAPDRTKRHNCFKGVTLRD